MNDVTRALREHLAGIEPADDALQRVLGTARRRRRWRAAGAGGAVAVVATVVALLGSGASSPRPAIPRQAATVAPLAPPQQTDRSATALSATELRAHLHIQGATKQPAAAIVVHAGRGSRSAGVVVGTEGGTRLSLPAGVRGVSSGPGGTVAAAAKDTLTVVRPAAGTSKATSVVVQTGGQARQITWNRNGTTLFALVGTHWVLVSAPRGATPKVRMLTVPTVPGGPTLLSISPDGRHVLLFSVTGAAHLGTGGDVPEPTTLTPLVPPSSARPPMTAPGAAGRPRALSPGPPTAQGSPAAASPAQAQPTPPAAPGGPRGAAGRTAGAPALHPHLYLGRFDGTAITHLRRIAVPAAAVSGPMGWLGDNAFLLAPAAGRALIVRIGQPNVLVTAQGIPNPCDPQSAGGSTCSEDGPWLMGTNAHGSLLFWKVRAVATGPGGTAGTVLQVRYAVTWLDGSHAAILAGRAAEYGPDVAPR